MKRILLIASLAFGGVVAHAEQVFVSDKLVVSVYAEANQDSDKLAQLESGDAVEAIEKAEGFTHVKLTDGREGWIKSSYLSAQTPAIGRVKELEKERSAGGAAATAATAEELKQLKEQNSVLHSEVTELKKAASQASAHQSAANVTATATRETSAPDDNADSVDSMHALKWGAAIALAAGLLGFTLGYRVITKRIERKYGKLKIY